MSHSLALEGYSSTMDRYVLGQKWSSSNELTLRGEFYSTSVEELPHIRYEERIVPIDVEELIELVRRGEEAGLELAKKILRRLGIEAPEDVLENLARMYYEFAKGKIKAVLREEELEDEYVPLFTVYLQYLVDRT